MAQATSRQWRSAEEIMLAHQEALAKGDLAAVVADYAPDAVIIASTTTARGQADIQEFFREVLIMLPPGSPIEIKNMVIERDIVYTLWSAKSQTHNMPFGSDTFFLRAGLIQFQTSAALIEKLT